MIKYIIISFVFISCNQKINVSHTDENYLVSSWGVKSISNDSRVYEELYIDLNHFYVFQEGALVRVLFYKLDENYIIFLREDNSVISKEIFTKHNDSLFTIFINNDITLRDVTYYKIQKGITPEDYMIKNYKRGFSKAFQIRRENYLSNLLGNGSD